MMSIFKKWYASIHKFVIPRMTLARDPAPSLLSKGPGSRARSMHGMTAGKIVRSRKYLGLFFSLLMIYSLDTHANLLQQNPATLTLTIVNHTNTTLSFAGIDHSRPGNTFQLSVVDIVPGGSTTVTATSNALFDIAAHLYLRDKQGNKNLLQIQDPRQLNSRSFGVFSMNNDRYVSFVRKQALNRDTNPQSVTWTAATVEIQNKIIV